MPPKVHWISASAGTGKTTALVDRYLELLETSKPENIICITFTNNAADEMKDRIRKKVANKTLRCHPDVSQDPENLILLDSAQAQNDRYNQDILLRIQTIHSLCHEILSQSPVCHSTEGQNPNNTGVNLDPAQAQDDICSSIPLKILSPTEKKLLIEEAFRIALDIDDSLTTQLSHRFSMYHLQTIIEKIFQRSYLLDPDYCHYDNIVQIFYPDLPQKNNMVSPDKQANDNTEQICHSAFMQNLENIVKSSDDSKFSLILKNLQTNYENVFLTQTGEIRKKILDKKTEALHPELKELFNKEAGRVYEVSKKRNLETWILDNKLIKAFTQRVYKHYLRLKQDQLDYDELLVCTKKFLEDDSHRYDVCKKIHHVLLDEAQDTNPNQWEIIELFTHHLFDDPTRDRSFFVVGDEKQSIYGFQNADPKFLQSQKKKYRTLSKEHFYEKELTTNYRAGIDICKYVEQTCHSPKMSCAKTFSGSIIETQNYKETLDQLLEMRPFLESQKRELQLSDILILCRKRDKIYKQVIDDYEAYISYEESLVLRDIPELEVLMYAALLQHDPGHKYARYFLENTVAPQLCHPREGEDPGNFTLAQWIPVQARDNSILTPFTLSKTLLSHNPLLLNLIIELITHHRITTFESLFQHLAFYPKEVKTITSADPHRMQLMTIHGAKGLEAPVVVFFNNWTSSYQKDIWWNYETGDFVLPPSKKITHPILQKIIDQNKVFETEEDKRLKYVALTRAIECLVIVN